ncbi:MAG: choice-of-anchor J domain-containing protein [Clostridia bacterium]|nr:choice-of-anchor J domain-containing protein [Clostridia bacterium]
MSKKFVCMLVAFLMVLSVIPMSAFAGGVPVKGDQIAFWNFDENTLDEDGWTVVDADGDGKNWTRYYGGSSNSYSPSYVISSASWDSTALAPDNWAITPAVEIPEDGAYLTYYTKNQGADWAETYRVYVGSSNDIDSMEPITDDLTHYNQTAYEKQTLDLADYAGETIYIAFRHYNVSNMYRFYIDDVAVNAGEPEVEPTPVPTVEPTPEPELPTLDEAVNVEGGNLEFVTQGDYPWVAYFDNGIVAAKSSNQGQGSSTSVLTTTVEANAGDTLAFNFKAWGEGNSSFWDKCEFKVNGETIKEWGAYQNSEWELYEYTFEEDGEFTIEWSYTKDSYVNPSGDYFAIDDVEVIPTDSVEYIDTIEINDFVEPAWNEEPFYDVTVPEDAHYSIDYTDWKYRADEGFDSLMGEGDVFDNSECAYFQYFEIVPDEGYKFADEVTVLINGSESNVDYDSSLLDEDVYYVYSVEFFVESVIQTDEPVVPTEEPVVPTEEPVVPTEEPVVPTEEPVNYIDTIEINGFVVPEWGAAPFYDVTVPKDAHYSIVYTDWNWWDWDNEEIMQEGDVFDNANVAYYQYFELVPDDGYAFVDELTILINGSEEYADTLFSGFDEEDNKFHIFTVDFFVEKPEFVTHWGDANGDGVVDSTDVLLLMRYVMGVDEIEEENLEWCDVNGDGSIDMSDALFVSRYVMGSIDVFPIEENE